MNGKHENRVLGRVLAVEGIVRVSGARPTSPSHDNITRVCADTSPTESECGVRTPTTNGVLAGSSISTILTHTSRV